MSDARPMNEIRHVDSLAEFEACVELQRDTWGADFSDVVPASILKVSQQIGGLVSGAFDGERMVGFVYSLVGSRQGTVVHWSHMLAVHPDARGHGLGRLLKLFQRSELLKAGVKTVFWTYDPLVARNAHLNLNRLGASIAGYVPNMYGSATGSPLHVGGDTDRLIVRWDLDSARAKWAVDGEVATDRSGSVADAEAISLPDIGETVEDVELPESHSVRIRVPCDLVAVARQKPAEVKTWRLLARRAFLHYLGRGYAVQSFHRVSPSDTCFYHLRRP